MIQVDVACFFHVFPPKVLAYSGVISPVADEEDYAIYHLFCQMKNPHHLVWGKAVELVETDR